MAQVQIYYGSQTGTAECFSEEIAEEAAAQGIQCEVLDLLTFTPEVFAARKIVVLCVSTYGEGEPSDNAKNFDKWASDPRNDGALKGQRFTVMGLGDMNYSKFNNMGMSTDLNLDRLGGKRLYQRGIGDDSQDIAADFKEWKDGGLWAALKKAIAEVMEEGGFPGGDTAGAAQVAEVVVKPEIHMFFAQEEADGAAKDICDAVVAELKGKGVDVAGIQSLSDRKAAEFVKKVPKRGVAVVIADCGPEGLCTAGRKIVRTMNLELDSKSLLDKDLHLAFLAVASSKCNTSASSLREQNETGAKNIPKAFERAGVDILKQKHPQYVDAGVDQVESVVQEFAAAIAEAVAAASIVASGGLGEGAAAPAAAQQKASRKTKILCAGPEAREAGGALGDVWPGGNCTVEDASLSTLAAAVQERAQVVLAVECDPEGNLSDAARGLAAQLGAAPMGIRATLRQLRFSLLAIAGTHYGNAGERASANAMREELTRSALPVVQALQKLGAACVTTSSLDLQDVEGDQLVEVCKSMQKAFSEGMPGAVAAPTNGYPAAAAAAPTAPPAAASSVALQLKMGPSVAALGAEVASEGSDVLARFYFEADTSKVLKVRELRQSPDHEKGLATAEVELEASGALKEYTLGGTLQLLPENDVVDVEAAVRLMGLSAASLGQFITWVPKDGMSAGMKIKKPFPTPCTLREALARYCDLGRVPSKKMLSALQPTLDSLTAREHVAKLLADAEALKLLQGPAMCCKMHEFWEMLGVKKIDPTDFLLHCPRQKPREFTIASSPKAAPLRITLCVSMTSHELPDAPTSVKKLIEAGCLPAGASLPASHSRFYGTCSRWLATRMKAGDVVLAKTRPSPLHLPAKDVPVIMIGSGAGVAPFRGIWEELRRGKQAAPAALFFGCRHPEQDWLFKEEMSSAVKLTNTGCGALSKMQVGPKRPLSCLFTAFSRLGDGKESKYVQHRLKEQSVSVKHWVEKMSGSVFICGSSAMGNAVLDTLAEILEGGRETVDSLRKDGRIVAEMWG